VGLHEEVSEWPMAQCQDCGRPFGREHHYQRSCPICFKESREYKILAGDKGLARLQVECGALQKELETYKALVQKLRRKPQEIGVKDRLRDLIALCHPDKHGNSRRATEVTQWLLQQRRR